MNKQLIAVIVAAVVLFVGAVAGAIAFTGDSSGDEVHTMPGGDTMTQPMETDAEEMPGMTMP